MRVTIFGSGYVGLVTGACLAEAGNHVVCVDVDAKKIDRLKAGEIPIHEPGLDVMVRRNAEAGRLRFTTDAVSGVEQRLRPGAERGHDLAAAGATFPFVLFDFRDPSDPPMVGLESMTDMRYFSEASQVHVYELVYDRMLSKALPEQESVDFMAALLEELS